MKFDFSTANRILFERGACKEIWGISSRLGKKALVVLGTKPEHVESILYVLDHHAISYEVVFISGEPTVEKVDSLVEKAHQSQCDHVISIGGGSALDTGKAIAAMLTNPGSLFDYLEVVGKNLPLQVPSAPMVAIPTTAGTGSEVTKNAVLTATEQKVKVSLRSPFLLPKVAMIDPELTLMVPKNVTAATGMDALAQLIEPFLSRRANPLTDLYCQEGITCVARSLYNAYEYGDTSIDAREEMSYASLLGGLSLANAGLGAVHGFAAPIGGMFNAAHGEICARLLAPVFRMNAEIMSGMENMSAGVEKCRTVARLLTQSPNAEIEDGIRWIEELVEDMKIPRLKELGIRTENFSLIIEKARVASSMQANPIPLSDSQLQNILETAW